MQEQDLIEKCKNGDEASFSLLITKYKRQLFSYLFHLSGNQQSAEDLFQETLIKVWQHMNRLQDNNKFSSWLFSIAHNLAMDFIAKKNNNLITSLKNAHSLISYNDPHTSFINKEETLIIQSIIDTFPAKQKEVFLLRVFSGKKFKEIAEITNEPLNTVLSHMHYAIQKIKTILDKENGKL